jgi:peroxin-19
MEQKPGDLEGLAETSTKILQTENAATTPAPSATVKSDVPTPPEEFPDPEEDDLDDLDGISYKFILLPVLMFSRYVR